MQPTLAKIFSLLWWLLSLLWKIYVHCAAQQSASKRILLENNVSAAIPGIWHWASLFIVYLYCSYSAGYLDTGQKCTNILFKALVQHRMQQGDSFPKGCSFLLPRPCKISCPGSKTSQQGASWINTSLSWVNSSLGKENSSLGQDVNFCRFPAKKAATVHFLAAASVSWSLTSY